MSHKISDDIEIGFIPLDWEEDIKTGIKTWKKIDLKEVSVPLRYFSKIAKDNEIMAEIPVEGEVDLEAYKKNPIVTANFNQEKVVGKVIDIKQEDNKLIVKIKLNKDLL